MAALGAGGAHEPVGGGGGRVDEVGGGGFGGGEGVGGASGLGGGELEVRDGGEEAR